MGYYLAQIMTDSGHLEAALLSVAGETKVF